METTIMGYIGDCSVILGLYPGLVTSGLGFGAPPNVSLSPPQ